ncbi:hypothetical protein StoSoilB3_35010 [Arthrobacter sp. StoSoilB3]|nr:hypothetical protein NtRootA2_34420 [Arthrobacter sp. NtRootA2]BCW28845.1 hypothetical protein NtRootC45_34450 [Arthrobacter sp. NtRootC45]BCW33115.1 hypothetical protein NtRootD5_34460 [Arthrobacter sp. NtRootD5]BCW41966.1 hypothetical protein StoSoilB3_35010 [Arthrobacter sp. StoSoilB3]
MSASSSTTTAWRGGEVETMAPLTNDAGYLSRLVMTYVTPAHMGERALQDLFSYLPEGFAQARGM